ncbi:hypothetical protein HYU11_04910 [Candidatus Woesearchaeota archaeon]|nr:hypothetical protein [Candidatus Woesearchaeota archaeon]
MKANESLEEKCLGLWDKISIASDTEYLSGNAPFIFHLRNVASGGVRFGEPKIEFTYYESMITPREVVGEITSASIYAEKGDKVIGEYRIYSTNGSLSGVQGSVFDKGKDVVYFFKF